MTWLLDGRYPALVDAGTGSAEHLDALEHLLGGRPLHRVLVTHNHSDHASGAEAILARFPGTRFAKIPWPGRDDRYPVAWESLGDGERVKAGDDAVEVVSTPGHAPDHACFWHGPSGVLFCGDLAIQGTTVVIPASAGGDLRDYIASLERVLALEPAQLLPAHGPVITAPARLLRLYLAHRRERDAQILEALARGAGSVDELVGRVYAGLADNLVRFARETVVAHLVKLEREGRVRRREEPREERWERLAH